MLNTPEAVAIGAVLASLQGSNLPIRRPSYNRPSFWSRPIMKTLSRPIPSGTPWQDFITVSGLKNYIATVSHFVATSVGNFALTNLEFQLLLDGAPLPMNGVELGLGIELNKSGPNTYPVIPRKLYQPVLETQTLALQVRNLGPLQRVAVGAFYGWYYETLDSTVFSGAQQGIADSGYAPFIGAPYG